MTARFDWNLQGLNETNFHALASLAQRHFRSLQLQEEADNANLTAEPEIDAGGHRSTESSDSHKPKLDPPADDSIAYSDDYLKRRFLDRLAEVWARNSDPDNVSAAVIRETSEGMTIWLARDRATRQPLHDHDREATEDNEFKAAFERFMTAAARNGTSKITRMG